MNAVRGLRLGHPAYLYQKIGSTNDEAKRLAESGAGEGLMVVAEEQTAGRGRMARRWLTPPGTALAFSLILRPPLLARLAPRLTMWAGLAVCEAIEQTTGLRAGLKWPNDVLLSGRKLGGILVEGALRGEALDYAVLGIGLNVSWSPPPSEVDYAATHLLAEIGEPPDRLKLLRAMLTCLEARYPSLADPGLLADWQARLLLMGEPIVIHTPQGDLRGLAQSVDEAGALIVRLDTGEIRQVLAGDVRLRRAE
jgi:BirA family transcriptional regulator, biotin operon repressor / biotin---[acetyl-CoA-carboxylase] ligase